MDVSVVIPNRNGEGLIGRCVRAAIASGANEVVVADDGSSDASRDEAVAAGAAVVDSPGRGFSAAVNAGARRATGEFLLVLNSDCFLEPDALGRMVTALADDPGLGLCGAALVEPDGSPGKSYGPSLTLSLALQTILSVNPATPLAGGSGVESVEFVPLACATIRRSAWDGLAGLDERFFFYFEDQDVCRRLGFAGWRLAVNWDATAVHVGGASSMSRDEQRWFIQYVRSRALFLRKHYPRSWPLFGVIWVPVALARAAVWSVRPGADSRRWAGAWLTAARAGVTG